jgi:phosphate transport system protein
VPQDDEILDRLEVEIDEMIILILTKAPLAGDLRLIPVAMKMSQNLERIGDEATKIAKSARALAAEPALKINFDIKTIADANINML